MLAARAHAKGLELTCEVAPDVPACVRGDPQRLRQVLLNLVGNAVKFTERGEVALRLERAVGARGGTGPARARRAAPAGRRRRWLAFAVQDTGIGIAPAKLALVFGAFTQADASTTRRYGGTGLGLAIVERLVALMGGRRCAAASAPGRGLDLHRQRAPGRPGRRGGAGARRCRPTWAGRACWWWTTAPPTA